MSLRLKLDKITPSINKMQRGFPQVVQLTYQQFVKITPKDTGNARNKTKLRGNTIRADYPYAQPLDDGWSKQAPKGMTEPALVFFKRLLRKLIRK